MMINIKGKNYKNTISTKIDTNKPESSSIKTTLHCLLAFYPNSELHTLLSKVRSRFVSYICSAQRNIREMVIQDVSSAMTNYLARSASMPRTYSK